jgi:large subunit ribosomal protein L30e
MADSTNSIRLAVDTGKSAIGLNDVIRSLRDNSSKLIVLAKINDPNTIQNIEHLSKVADVKIQYFEGNSMELGSACGKPFSVSALSIIDPGTSDILNKLEETSSK